MAAGLLDVTLPPSGRVADAAGGWTTPARPGAIHPLVDPSGSLDRFFETLRRTEMREPDAVTHILHYGDSPTTADLITADVRDLLQKQFGDAGHGFCLIGQPWAWYMHRGVGISGSGWRISPATQSALRDGMYGLGGASFEGVDGDASHLALTRDGHTGLEVAFLRQPAGGSFSVIAGDATLAAVDTAGDVAGPGFAPVGLPSGARRFSIRVDRGPVRLFGVHLTRPAPGVIYSSLGLNGAYVSVLARVFREKHWREQLRHYRPALVIVNYGTNESVYENFVDFAYEK